MAIIAHTCLAYVIAVVEYPSLCVGEEDVVADSVCVLPFVYISSVPNLSNHESLPSYHSNSEKKNYKTSNHCTQKCR